MKNLLLVLGVICAVIFAFGCKAKMPEPVEIPPIDLSEPAEVKEEPKEEVKAEVDGLKIEDVSVGSGEAVKEGATVKVHYTGMLKDGKVFDSSKERGEPFSFTVGEGRVIEGWEKGLIGMKKGGKRILTIPPELGYGDRDLGDIPPNSTLIFEIELLDFE